jgi:hypothetical protein
MRAVTKSVLLLLVALAAGLALAGCGSGVSSAIKNLAPSASVRVPSAQLPTPSPSPVPATQHRADDLAQTLYTMREAAPDEEERARVADVLGSLQAVRSAMGAERAPGGAGAGQAEVVRGRLRGFQTALQALRPPDTPFA